MSDENEEQGTSFGGTVVIVNRTKKDVLGATWDGAHYKFKPGPTSGVPLAVAVAAYKQNPLHGSEDMLGDTEAFVSLIGIKGAKPPYSDCSPLEQSNAGERLNRKEIAGDGARAKPRNAGAADTVTRTD